MAVRVIQWATGSVGRTVLRRLIDHPEMEVVGVYVSNPRKVGVDAGTLVKRPETGVLATNDVEAILALDADVVIHTPLILPPYERQNEEVARLLASGKNVISTNGFYRPDIHGAGYSAPLLAAAETGNATLAGSGLNPGVIAERIAVTLSCMMARIDQNRSPTRRAFFLARWVSASIQQKRIFGPAPSPKCIMNIMPRCFITSQTSSIPK